MKSAEKYYAPQDIQEEEVPRDDAGAEPGSDGLGHHGDPEGPVVEEQDGDPHSPVVVRAPREPTQKEREAHEALHLPHADWCEFCMTGRARNKAHRKVGTGGRACTSADVPSIGEGPVSKVSLDYFFFGDSHPKMSKPVSKVTTKQLEAKLYIAQLPTSGSRMEMEKRFNEFKRQTLAEAGMSSSDEDDDQQGQNRASDFPAIVMVDENTGTNTCVWFPAKASVRTARPSGSSMTYMKSSRRGVSRAGARTH